MDYQVPQFIEVEDKIFGPLTLKQFIYVAGGVGICAIFFFSLPFFFAIILSIPVGSLAAALAFYKVNGKTFVEMLEYGTNYFIGKYTGRSFYRWRKVVDPVTPSTTPSDTPVAAPSAPREGLTKRKLEELAWSLDVKTGRDQTIT